MPRKSRKNVKGNRKRNTGGKGKTGNRVSMVSRKLGRALAGTMADSSFIKNWPPQRLYVDFCWDIAFSVTTSTALVETILSGNNPYDPGLALAATQPQWFDQITAFYVKYRCWASAIEVHIMSDSTDEPCDLVLYPTRSSTGVVTFASSAAQPFSVVKQIGIATGSARTTFRKRMDSSKMFGTPIQFSEDYSGATAVGTLTNQWYWLIVQVSADDTTSASNDYLVRLHMKVELFDRGWSEISEDGSNELITIPRIARWKNDVRSMQVKNATKHYFLSRPFRQSFDKNFRRDVSVPLGL
jgi:hypothetical protein